MKERPILFSAPMVRAILAGRKTQTRRIVKTPTRSPHLVFLDYGKGWWPFESNDGESAVMGDGCEYPLACPHGQSGDRLWVREKWRVGMWREDDGQIAIDYSDGPLKAWRDVTDPDKFVEMWQQSSDDAAAVYGELDRYKWEPGQSPCRWRSPIHMPRWASRITLEVTGVRVEQLQDISEADAIAEGLEQSKYGYSYAPDQGTWFSNPTFAFRDLWGSINGSDSWAANPWVWVIEFKRVGRQTRDGAELYAEVNHAHA